MKMKKNINWLFLIIGLVALLGFGQVAQAGLTAVGPIDPANGFPVWYQDANTLALIPCLSQTQSPNVPPNLMCVLLGDPGFNVLLPVVFPTNYPQESFYWIADATSAVGNPFATYVKIIRLGLESTFATIPPTVANGQQTVFSRIRIRIDPPVAGTYTVTHPFGVKVYPNAPAGIKGINDTIDIPLGAPLNFTGALNGGIGPFLRWPDLNYPIIIGNERFIGDPNVAHTVTGSPTGFNKVRVAGPTGLGVFGGSDFVETDLFFVAGKIFNGTLPTPVSVTRASYSRSNANPSVGQVDVFATSTPTASLTVNAGGVIPAWPMTGDGTGRFFAHIPIASAAVLPATLSVTADDSVANPTNIAATVTVNLQDLVTIAQADYSAASGLLTVTANSSDLLAPVPALTLAGFTPGTLNNGSLTNFATPTPPPSITVSSSNGGSDAQNVAVAAAAGSLVPVARNDAAHTLPATPVIVNVTANDLALGSSLNLASVTVVPGSATGGNAVANGDGTVTFTPNITGTGSFRYTVADTALVPLTSNQATVTVTVAAAPVAVNDTAVTSQNTTTVINILANDTAAVGLTLNPSTVVSVPFPTTAHGTISVNPGTGAVTYTPTLGYFGPDSFTYTVKDNLGTISNPAPVTITVASPGPTAVNDFATTVQGQAVAIPVLANDLGALNFTTLVIASPPVLGSAVVNTLNGTITYTPPVTFTGPVTFTYTVRNTLGFISNAATVTVTVNPFTETITVAKAEFNARLRLWTVTGKTTAPVPPNNIMTIRTGSLAGTLLGAATVDATGNWVFNQANSAIPFNATVSVQSSYGTAVTGPVRLR